MITRRQATQAVLEAQVRFRKQVDDLSAKMKEPTAMELVARAFSYLARILHDKGRRLERAHVQSTWVVIPPGSGWQRRDGSFAKMGPTNRHGTRRERRAPSWVATRSSSSPSTHARR